MRRSTWVGCALLIAACRGERKAPPIVQQVAQAGVVKRSTLDSAADPAADSVRRFVQSFYDWYAPLDGDRDGSARTSPYDSVLIARPEALTPELLAAFRADVQKQRADTTGEIVSVSADYDVFLSSQDPCGHYDAGAVVRTAHGWSVKVQGDCGQAVVADVVRIARRWAIANIVSDDGDLLTQLTTPDTTGGSTQPASDSTTSRP